MATATETLGSRIYVRCKTSQKELIDRAAETLGTTTSDYVLSTVLDRAMEDVHRRNRIVLNDAAYDQLLDFLDQDSAPSESLLRHAREYREAIDRGELTVAD